MTNAPAASERVAKLVRQHAETSRLLGVDFVPVIRSARPDPVGAAPPPTEPAEAPVRIETAATAPAPAPQPAAPAPKPKSEPSPKPEAAARPGSRKTTRADRDDAQRRLDELRARYEKDAPHKNFVTAHTNIVWGEGDPRAQLMFVGEAPGADEDRTGRPFVGRAGQLLEKMITAMGLDRADVYIANVLKTRPPNNATPTKEEAAASAPYLFEQIAIIRPDVIVTLGLPAAKIILGTDDTMTRLRGRWAEFKLAPATALGKPDSIPVMPTYHPAYLLRAYTPDNRAKVWSDLRQVMDRLGLKGSGGAIER